MKASPQQLYSGSPSPADDAAMQVSNKSDITDVRMWFTSQGFEQEELLVEHENRFLRLQIHCPHVNKGK